jgi:Uma2 family endonuclease
MNIANVASETAATAPPQRRHRIGKEKKITIAEFLENYSQREDGCKYEYVDGYVIKSTYTMSDPQQHIANNLIRFFYRLESQGILQGNLVAEKDTWLSETKWRKPDLSYMSPIHSYEAAQGGRPKPEFVIELVSPNDTAEYYDTKLDEYYAAGVKVVWFIYPKSEKVVVYQADRSSTTCIGDTVCSAAPVLPEFVLAAKDVFSKPAKPL